MVLEAFALCKEALSWPSVIGMGKKRKIVAGYRKKKKGKL